MFSFVCYQIVVITWDECSSVNFFDKGRHTLAHTLYIFLQNCSKSLSETLRVPFSMSAHRIIMLDLSLKQSAAFHFNELLTF